MNQPSHLPPDANVARSADQIEESARQLPVCGRYDVIVCGGGPAGIGAAIAAARAGAATALLELHGCLGGIWTSGMLCNIIDTANKTGIVQEILAKLDQRGTQLAPRYYDVEAMKLLLEEECAKAGVNILLHTQVVNAVVREKRIVAVITENRSGRQALSGKVFIDSTGDGILAQRAGCGFDLGHPETGEIQPMSLMALITGIDGEELQQKGYVRNLRPDPGAPVIDHKGKFAAVLKEAGIETSYSRPSLFPIRNDLMAMMANHEYGIQSDDAAGITWATIRARAEINRIVDSLRALGDCWANVRLAQTAGQIGIREGKRIHGLYQLTNDDVLSGARFEDAVCESTFGVDIHATKRSDGGGYSNQGLKARPFQIPFRSLVAKDVEGLLIAGRCISGDFFAHASYRVTGNAVAMGEAAGIAAAHSARENISTHALRWPARSG